MRAVHGSPGTTFGASAPATEAERRLVPRLPIVPASTGAEAGAADERRRTQRSAHATTTTDAPIADRRTQRPATAGSTTADAPVGDWDVEAPVSGAGGSLARPPRTGAAVSRGSAAASATSATTGTPGAADRHPALAPRAPLELTGLRRDDAKLLVAWRSDGRLVAARMADLDRFLEAGDVLVVNTSATRPAAIVVDDDLVVHLSTELAGGAWVVELRHLAGEGSTPLLDHRPSGPIALPGGAQLELLGPYRPAGHRRLPWERHAELAAGTREAGVVATDRSVDGAADGRAAGSTRPTGPGGSTETVRLWTARLRLPPGGARRSGAAAAPAERGSAAAGPLDEYLARYGRPIRYGPDAGAWPLDAYQTVFATEAGSAEMPSAARGFTAELVTRLVSRGVTIAPILLHTGVASQEAGETPYPERYVVGETTATAVNAARAAGHRIIAVGTTATRAIETVADPDGRVRPASGWTDLVITPERGVHVVDGLLTGWHDPEASHLFLVEAVAGRQLLDRSYAAAIAGDFAGHEFGDLHLILP